MPTFNLPPRLSAILDHRAGKPVPPHKPARYRPPLLPRTLPDRPVAAQAARSRPRSENSEATDSGPVERVAAVVLHDAVGLMHIVLAAAYAGGRHLAYTDGAFQCFDHTHWRPLSEKELGREILTHLPSATNRGGRQARALIREVVDLLKMHRATGPDRARLDDPPPIINVANGELWVGPDGSVELRPHDPASGLKYCLDVIYDPNAECPVYDRTLTEIFRASQDPIELVNHWHEFVGYVLQPTRPDARIFVGWGAGNDGKTALAGLLVRLLGPDRVATMAVETLISNRFMLGHLADKALFLDDDIAVGTVLPDGLLKTISEAKVVTGEAKHRDAFEFQVRSLPLLFCNAAPLLHDASRGFYRRLFVFPFERRFTDAEADRTLFPRIWVAERSGVLNRALAGLRGVAQRGWKFEPSEVVKQATEAWWAEATGLEAPTTPVTRRTPVQAKRQQVPIVQAPPTTSGQPLTHEARPVTANPGPNVNVRVALPEASKGCTVHVQVGGAEVEVSVTAASAARALPREKVLADR